MSDPVTFVPNRGLSIVARDIPSEPTPQPQMAPHNSKPPASIQLRHHLGRDVPQVEGSHRTGVVADITTHEPESVFEGTVAKLDELTTCDSRIPQVDHR
jgi:hypothetical protein